MRSAADYLQIPVDLGERGYPVLLGENILSEIGTLLRRRHLLGPVAVISTPPILEVYGATIAEALESWDAPVLTLTIEDGEENKNLDTVRRLYDELLAQKWERNGTILALGGGLVGDTAGFVAATLLRGINLVQIPTTILSQVDASIGGKVGVNHGEGKNLIGAIYQPRFVLADIATLHSLPEREVRSGLAEVIKYGVIREKALFEYIEQHLEDLMACRSEQLLHAIAECCRIKAEIVQADERELTGLRAILNFGHTVGHALEALTGYSRFRHGEAVAVGMVVAARMGVALTGFAEEEFQRFVTLIRRAGFSLDIGDLDDNAILEQTRADKKVLDGRVRYVLPRSLGDVVLEPEVPGTTVREALDHVRTLD
jgi:3-dehydroquinate synthase